MKVFKRLLFVIVVMSLFILPTANFEAATKVKLNKTKATIEVGKSLTVKINGTKSKVTWTSTNKKVATVSNKGKVVAKKTGTAKIKAKVDGKTYTCTIKVKAPELEEIVNEGLDIGLIVGEKERLFYECLPPGAKMRDKIWESSDEDVAYVDEKGYVHGVSVGSTTITLSDGEGFSCEWSVVVREPKLSVDKSSITIVAGKTETINIDVEQSHKISCSSSDDTIAKVDFLYTFEEELGIKALKAGTATITLTDKTANKSIAISVTVREAEFSTSETSIKLKKGESKTVIITNEDGNAMNVEISSTTIASTKWGEWKDNMTVPLTINSLSAGTTNLTIVDQNTNKKITIVVIVEEDPPLARLANYIQTYGTKNTAGNRFIKTVDYRNGNKFEYAIVYEEAKQSFSFVCVVDDGSNLTMSLDANGNKYSEVRYLYLNKSELMAIDGTAQFDISSYNLDSTQLTFDISSKLGFSTADANNIANLTHKMALTAWDIMLWSDLSINLKDLGFTNY